jgi:site-specific DNA-methyltransferase (adenine-specific)
LSEHRVILGDCLDPVTGLASLPDKSVDHMLTDPPYAKVVVNSAKTGPTTRWRMDETQTLGGVRRNLGYAGISDEQRIAVGAQIGRVTKRWAIVFCDAESLHLWRAALEAGGMRYVRTGIWVAPNPTPQFTGDRPGTGFEPCIIAHAKGRSRWNGGGLPAVWIFNRPENGTDARANMGHPSPKPPLLMEALVRFFTDPGELIADAFTGSGTTGIAAKRHGRRFVGWELKPEYHAIAVKRIEAAREQYRLPLPSEPEPKQVALLPTAGPHRGAAAGAGGSLPGPAAVPAMEREG